jgi:hypothetical protein
MLVPSAVMTSTLPPASKAIFVPSGDHAAASLVALKWFVRSVLPVPSLAIEKTSSNVPPHAVTASVNASFVPCQDGCGPEVSGGGSVPLPSALTT